MVITKLARKNTATTEPLFFLQKPLTTQPQVFFEDSCGSTPLTPE